MIDKSGPGKIHEMILVKVIKVKNLSVQIRILLLHPSSVLRARIPSFSRFSLAKAFEGRSLDMYNPFAPGSFAYRK